MTLKHDMIRAGYLPENMPPPFHSEDIASFFFDNSAGYLSSDKTPMRSSNYSASKRGISRRNFSAVHPITSHDLAEFFEKRSTDVYNFFDKSAYSFSVPYRTPDEDRAVEISSHSKLERERLLRLSGYRFIAKTDISRFYHSIYTHSVAWAFHGKAAAKKVRRYDADDIFFNRLDFTLRQGQDGQTIGIPVGPDASRYVAELISTAIDREFASRCDVRDFAVVRHVDDVWIGVHSHADAERSLWRYRESLREFELDINENKTHIYAANFRFTDAWPSDGRHSSRFSCVQLYISVTPLITWHEYSSGESSQKTIWTTDGAQYCNRCLIIMGNSVTTAKHVGCYLPLSNWKYRYPMLSR
jgi:hypothetical protein